MGGRGVPTAALVLLAAAILAAPGSALASAPKLTVSAKATAGQKLAVTVVATKKGKRYRGFRGRVKLTTTDARAVLPPAHKYTRADAGRFRFSGLELRSAGTWSVSAKAGGAKASRKVSVAPGALASMTLSPAGASISPPAPTGVHAIFSPLTPDSPQTSKLFSVSGADRFGNARPDTSSTAVLSIAPDGSCAASLCSPASPGAHTVTAAAGGVTATAQLDVGPLAGSYSMACQGENFDLNGNLTDGCEAALDHLTVSPPGPAIALAAPTGAHATFTPVGPGTPSTSQAFTVSGATISGAPVGDLTSRATWTIAPDGSCAGAVCTPASSGPHTVTATVGSFADGTSLGVDPLSTTYTMTCQGENYDVNGAMADGCEEAAPHAGNGTAATYIDLGEIDRCDDSERTVSGAIISDARTHSPAVGGFDSNTGAPPEYFRIDLNDSGIGCSSEVHVRVTASGGATNPPDCYKATVSWIYDSGMNHVQLGPLSGTFSGTDSELITGSLDAGSFPNQDRSARFTVKLEAICAPPRNERVNFELKIHF